MVERCNTWLGANTLQVVRSSAPVWCCSLVLPCGTCDAQVVHRQRRSNSRFLAAIRRTMAGKSWTCDGLTSEVDVVHSRRMLNNTSLVQLHRLKPRFRDEHGSCVTATCMVDHPRQIAASSLTTLEHTSAIEGYIGAEHAWSKITLQRPRGYAVAYSTTRCVWFHGRPVPASVS